MTVVWDRPWKLGSMPSIYVVHCYVSSHVGGLELVWRRRGRAHWVPATSAFFRRPLLIRTTSYSEANCCIRKWIRTEPERLCRKKTSTHKFCEIRTLSDLYYLAVTLPPSSRKVIEHLYVDPLPRGRTPPLIWVLVIFDFFAPWYRRSWEAFSVESS